MIWTIRSKSVSLGISFIPEICNIGSTSGSNCWTSRPYSRLGRMKVKTYKRQCEHMSPECRTGNGQVDGQVDEIC